MWPSSWFIRIRDWHTTEGNYNSRYNCISVSGSFDRATTYIIIRRNSSKVKRKRRCCTGASFYLYLFIARYKHASIYWLAIRKRRNHQNSGQEERKSGSRARFCDDGHVDANFAHIKFLYVEYYHYASLLDYYYISLFLVLIGMWSLPSSYTYVYPCSMKHDTIMPCRILVWYMYTFPHKMYISSLCNMKIFLLLKQRTAVSGAC